MIFQRDIIDADFDGCLATQKGSYFPLFFFLREPYLTERLSALATESLSFFSLSRRSLPCTPASL